jgi:hypothetical protein
LVTEPIENKDSAPPKGAHTPGPWRVSSPARYGNRKEIFGLSNEHVAGVGDLGEQVAPFDSEANARLIAAAPELLAALEWTTDRFAAAVQHDKAENELADCGHCGVIEEARAVIRKARGEA